MMTLNTLSASISLVLTPDTPHAHINKSISTEPVFYFSRQGDDQYLGQSNNSDPGLEPVDAEGFLNELVAQHSLEDKMPAARKWVANDFYEGQMTLETLRIKAGLTQRSEEHKSELQSRFEHVCRLLIELLQI